MILPKIQSWQPYIDGSLLHDVATVLDDNMPGEEEVDDSALRMRGHLMRLVNLAVTDRVVEQDACIAQLVERARMVRSEELPGDHRKAVGHVRRMAWTLNELLERLIENQVPQGGSVFVPPLPYSPPRRPGDPGLKDTARQPGCPPAEAVGQSKRPAREADPDRSPAVEMSLTAPGPQEVTTREGDAP
ncbi:DUF6415 family natural product biosynthesis protein [Streptomyces galilaeus]